MTTSSAIWFKLIAESIVDYNLARKTVNASEMKIEKEFTGMRAADFLMFTLFMSLLLLIMVSLLLIITGKGLSSIREIAIIWTFYTLIAGWLNSSINKPGVMAISNYYNIDMLFKTLETGANKQGFVIVERTDSHIIFDKKSKIARFFNLFGRENLMIIIENERVLIHAKRNILIRLESRLKREFK